MVKIKKGVPKKIFIEMARAEDKVKKRTVSRKNTLVELYKNCKKDAPELAAILETKDDRELQRDRLYLYFTQLGRCMYSGENINIHDIFNQNIYDVDHIYPQSKVKDDSLDNRVLVKRTVNAKKGDSYPLSSDIQASQYGLWEVLKEKNLISQRKYDRLARSTEFSDSELEGFIARQLVETRQSTKAVADILKKLYPDTEIVYVKAGNVSDFRQKFDIVKCRDVNDYHHAKDAYLNIVVGNVYNTKCTHNRFNFIKGLKDRTYSMNRMFDFDTENAWVKGSGGSINTIKKVISKNNILFTRYATEKHGGFFDQTIMKKGSGQTPIKAGDTRLNNIDKYGGYNKVAGSYFMFVEHLLKGKKVRSLETVYLMYKDMYEHSEADALDYCTKILGLLSPKILIKKIKFDSLLCYNGFYMHISARTGNQMRLKCAMQLCIGYEFEAYIKKISKYLDKCKKAKSDLKITDYDGITNEANVKLYELFINKFTNTAYKVKFENQAETLRNNKLSFENISLEQQCKIISEILKMIQCNAALGDLSLLCNGKNSQAGAIYINKNISQIKELKKIKLIYQSITGVFEQEIDMQSEDLSVRSRK